MRERVRAELDRRYQHWDPYTPHSEFEEACVDAFAEALCAAREEIVLWYPAMHLPSDEE